MRVALINNMNNNFFAFTRYLRDRGIDAHLFIIDKLPAHFLPSADTFEDPEALSYVHYLDAGSFKLYHFIQQARLLRKFNRFIKLLKTFDLTIACGNLAYLEFKQIRIDVFMPFGGDIFQSIKLHQLSGRHGIVYVYHRYLAYLQTRAIRRSRLVCALASIDGLVLEALDYLKKPWLEATVPMVYPLRLPDTSSKWDFLSGHDFILFSHTRQSWLNLSNENYKGNEKYINAFASFIKLNSRFANPILVLFEYGETVDASKALIASLGIASYVKWMPIMPRKEIYYGLAKASVVIDALTDKVASFGGVVFEAFLHGKPVIGTARTLTSIHAAKTDLPLIDAFTEQDVLTILLDYQTHPEKYATLGLQAQNWFHEHIGRDKVNEYIKVFDLLVKHKELTAESPLFREKLTSLTDLKVQ